MNGITEAQREKILRVSAIVFAAEIDKFKTQRHGQSGRTIDVGALAIRACKCYDKEVFNGDIGVVEAVDLEDRAMDVRFDDRTVRYDVTELDELVLAYATTIH